MKAIIRCVIYFFLLPLFIFSCQTPEKEVTSIAKISFNYDIKPILSDRCFACHGPDANKREADLRLDTPEGAFAALKDNPGHFAIIAGDPDESEMYRRLISDDPDIKMPPPESNLSISEEEISLIKKWIAQGAEYEKHWSFIKPEKALVPDSADHPIDYFIDKKLAEKKLQPTVKAEKELLLRRLSFDITVLPPSVDELDAFLSDNSPDAYEKAVDRLLDSPAYGERMAMHWLDVARYADTHGYQFDFEREVWPWRDWVIQAFNQNMPYEQFVTWQLAGDLLPNPTQEQVMATAFNRNHPQNPEGGIIPEEYRVEYVADRTNTLGKAFLGLTLECARCHDHKYDPLSQKEYYELFAFFNNVDEAGQISYFTRGEAAPTLLLTDQEAEEQISFLKEKVAEEEKALANVKVAAEQVFEQWLQNNPSAPQKLKGMQAYISMDVLQGETLKNEANAAHPAKVFDEPEVIEGARGKGLLLNGENGINLNKVGDFSRSEPFSISIWIKPPKILARAVILHRSRGALDAASRGYELYLDSGRVVAALNHNWPYNAIKIRTKEPIQNQAWTQLAMTYDGSSRAANLKIFVNGEEAEAEILRDNLYKDIRYDDNKLPLQLGARFRDNGFKDGAVDELMVFDRRLTAPEIAMLAGKENTFHKEIDALSEADKAKLFDFYLENHHSAYQKQFAELKEVRKQLASEVEKVREMMVMDERENTRPSYLLERGGYDNHGERVFPDTPERVLAFDETFPANRLGLTQWLFHEENPLTARVMANRLWQLFFGEGIVNTPDDFGNQGSLPSHPELLDWLAVEFRESGWDMQHMIRLVVTTEAYQRSSVPTRELKESDPENQWLAYGPKHRLKAEMIRDHALASSGLLNREMGGPPVKPYQPEGLWKEKKADMVYVPSTGDDLFRRSLYTFWKRTSPPPNMLTFDASERNVCIVKREATATPLQSLVLLNDPQFVEASRVLAERLLTELPDSPEDKITFAFRSLTSRTPSAEELTILKETYEEQLAYYRENPKKADQLLEVGERELQFKENPQQLAAYTMLASTIMNFEDTYLKY
jgi:hypothetical protein